MKHTPRFIQYYLAIAHITASMSYSRRLHVGCVIVDPTNSIISTGYNGTRPGDDNNCEHETDQGLKTDHDRVVHAEYNALTRLEERGISAKGGTLLITHAPCLHCAERIVKDGIKTVYFMNYYRDRAGLGYLIDNGVHVERQDLISLPTPSLNDSVESAK